MNINKLNLIEDPEQKALSSPAAEKFMITLEEMNRDMDKWERENPKSTMLETALSFLSYFIGGVVIPCAWLYLIFFVNPVWFFAPVVLLPVAGILHMVYLLTYKPKLA